MCVMQGPCHASNCSFLLKAHDVVYPTQRPGPCRVTQMIDVMRLDARPQAPNSPWDPPVDTCSHDVVLLAFCPQFIQG